MSAKENASAALAAKHRIEQGLEALRTGLNPYVEKHMRDRFGLNWIRARKPGAGQPSRWKAGCPCPPEDVGRQLECAFFTVTRNCAGRGVSFPSRWMRETLLRIRRAR